MEPIKFTLKKKADIERKRLDLEIRSIIVPIDMSYISDEDFFWVKVEIRKQYLAHLATKFPADFVQEMKVTPEFDAYFEQILTFSDKDLLEGHHVGFYDKKNYIEATIKLLKHLYPNRAVLNFISN